MGLERLAALILGRPEIIHVEPDMKSYSGKVVAVDATARLLTCIKGHPEAFNYMLYFFLKTLPEIESGLRPVYVFNSPSPSGKIMDRTDVRKKLRQQLKEAREAKSPLASVIKKKLVKTKSDQVESVKRLLWLLGLPYLDAPGEAAAQCSSMVRAGQAFAAINNGIVPLVYGADILLMGSKYRKSLHKKNYWLSVQELRLHKVLDVFQLNFNEFVDLTVLIGCEYSLPVKFIGALRGLRMIRKFHSIEGCLDEIRRGQYVEPENWNYEEARERYLHPAVKEVDSSELTWSPPDLHGVIDYLCRYYRFDLETVQKALVKLSHRDINL